MDISIGSYKFRLEILILIVIVFWIMFGHLLCSCCIFSLREGLELAKDTAKKTTEEIKKGIKEGFTPNRSSYGPEFAKNNTPGYMVEPSKWAMPTLTYTPGKKPDAAVKAVWDRQEQPIPLPEGELDMFATTPFKPECCPNTYSNSSGCACMTMDQYSYLRERGSNNVPYSEY
jgi:hypothetical protein